MMRTHPTVNLSAQPNCTRNAEQFKKFCKNKLTIKNKLSKNKFNHQQISLCDRDNCDENLHNTATVVRKILFQSLEKSQFNIPSHHHARVMT